MGRNIVKAVSLFGLLLIFACGGRGVLETMPVMDDEAIEGQYDLILYEEEVEGTRNAFALLDMGGDPYEFVPASLRGDVRRQRVLQAEEALERAGAFLEAEESHPISIKRIVRGNAVIGYELKPMDDYFGPPPAPNLLRISYDIEGTKVKFNIRILPQRERESGYR